MFLDRLVATEVQRRDYICSIVDALTGDDNRHNERSILLIHRRGGLTDSNAK
jgi:hypothetical protein